eukprot:scaffold56312_cov29-Tisochrysis_lutea.AAC.1
MLLFALLPAAAARCYRPVVLSSSSRLEALLSPSRSLSLPPSLSLSPSTFSLSHPALSSLSSLSEARRRMGSARMCAEPPLAQLEAAIQAQGDLVRQLKAAESRDADAIAAAVADLLALKAKLPTAEVPKQPAQTPPKKKDGPSKRKLESEEELSEDELFQRRLQKAQALAAAGKQPYAYSYERTHTSDVFARDFADLPAGAVDEDASVSLCGRVMTKRMFGKLAFITVQVWRAPCCRPRASPEADWPSACRDRRMRRARSSFTLTRRSWVTHSKRLLTAPTPATLSAPKAASSGPTRASFPSLLPRRGHPSLSLCPLSRHAHAPLLLD